MNPNKTNTNKPGKSALGSLLNEKNPKIPTLVPPVLQQVGQLAAGVASVSTASLNPGSATGNPRNKCALQPGHSLMDWIRLGASGKDLTGVGTRAGQLSVTRDELSQHNKRDDVWLAIRGKVFNVTAYLPFHPGGPDDLMRGAGIDATSIFDQVHSWVNYDQILQKCLIGRLVNIDHGVDKEVLFFGAKNDLEDLPEFKIKSKESKESIREEITSGVPKVESTSTSVNPVDEVDQEEPNEEAPSLPRFDWIQKIDYITVIFYTKAFSNPLVEIYPPNPEKIIIISLTYEEYLFKNELLFYEGVDWPCSVKVTCETGKVELIFKKIEGRIWDNYGVLRQQSKKVVPVYGAKFNFVFKNKVQINHNIYLLKLRRTDGAKVVVPIGKHVQVFGNIDGREMSRSYTPVPYSLFTKLCLHGATTDAICLMIKRYETGNVSRFLTDRIEHDLVYVTKPMGDFELQQVERRETFLLLAAGTGITPMLGLVIFLLERRIKKCQFVRILFFNKTEEDIPFKDQLDGLEGDDCRLIINHILSEPNENWAGFTGHVNTKIIENSLQEHIKDTGYTIRDIYTFICGPTPFVTLAMQELEQTGITEEQIHVFQG